MLKIDKLFIKNVYEIKRYFPDLVLLNPDDEFDFS